MKFSSRDLHIHTSLSSCAARTADASGYIAAAARGGLELIGFANHYWDEAVPGRFRVVRAAKYRARALLEE